jgi:hypothetical protein
LIYYVLLYTGMRFVTNYYCCQNNKQSTCMYFVLICKLFLLCGSACTPRDCFWLRSRPRGPPPGTIVRNPKEEDVLVRKLLFCKQVEGAAPLCSTNRAVFA